MSLPSVLCSLAVGVLCTLSGCATPSNRSSQNADYDEVALQMLAEAHHLAEKGDLEGARSLASRVGQFPVDDQTRVDPRSGLNAAGMGSAGAKQPRSIFVGPKSLFERQRLTSLKRLGIEQWLLGLRKRNPDKDTRLRNGRPIEWTAADDLQDQPNIRSPQTRSNSRFDSEQDPAVGNTQKLSVFDAETLRYINNELKDAAPSEREQVLRTLQGADPAMVRRILQERRRVQQMRQYAATGEQSPASQPNTGVSATRSSQLDQIFPDFGHSKLRAPDPRQQNVVRTLGMANPWNQQQADSALAKFQQGSLATTNRTQGDLRSQLQSDTGAVQRPINSYNQNPSSTTGAPTIQPASSGNQVLNGNPQSTVTTGNPVELAGVLESDPLTEESQLAQLTPGQSPDTSIPLVDPSGGPSGGNQNPTTANNADGSINSAIGNRSTVSQWGNALLDQIPSQQSILHAPAGLRSALVNAGQEIRNGLSGQWVGNVFAQDGTRGPGDAQSGVVTQPLNSLNPNVQISSVASPPAIPNLNQLITAASAAISASTPGTTESQRQSYIANHVNLRMLYLVAGQHQLAIEPIPNIDSADQEFWQQMFWAVSNYFDENGMPDSSDRATEAIAQLTSAIARLREKAKLELRNVSFCHKIVSYGSFERFNKDVFSPGQPVLLYCEVGNFKSETTPAGRQRTVLRSVIEIFQDGLDGELVDRIEFPATEDLCNSRRKDYFHSYEFNIPQRAGFGPHVVKLTVEDQLSQKIVSYALKFTVE